MYWRNLDPKKKAVYTERRVVAAREKRKKAFEDALEAYRDKPPLPPMEKHPIKIKHLGFKTIEFDDLMQQYNKLYKSGKIKREQADTACKCKYHCGDDCYNKCAQMECTDDNCNVKAGCGNRHWTGCGNRWISESHFLTSCAPGEERHYREKLGMGLKATEDIPQGVIIGPYVGELLTRDQLKHIKTNDYVSELGDGIYIDASKKGNLTRYINHSHEPNCEAVKRLIDGFTTKWIITTRPITAKEFLSMEYNIGVENCKNRCCRYQKGKGKGKGSKK